MDPTTKKVTLSSSLPKHFTLTHESFNLVFYTGTAGDPVPIVKGWLRASLRKVDEQHPKHKKYLPYRHYFSNDVQPLELGKVYTLDVEIWPTNVVIAEGGKLVVEIAGQDTQGSGYFTHNHLEDRPESKFKGCNRLHFGEGMDNYLLAPVIPEKK